MTANLRLPTVTLNIRKDHLVMSSVYIHRGDIYLNHICRKHHLNHKHPRSCQLPAAMLCALKQSRGGSCHTWLHKAEQKMCPLPPNGPTHRTGCFYCPVVKCHFGRLVSAFTTLWNLEKIGKAFPGTVAHDRLIKVHCKFHDLSCKIYSIMEIIQLSESSKVSVKYGS